jgi:hypothetical protein
LSRLFNESGYRWKIPMNAAVIIVFAAAFIAELWWIAKTRS